MTFVFLLTRDGEGLSVFEVGSVSIIFLGSFTVVGILILFLCRIWFWLGIVKLFWKRLLKTKS